MILGQISYLDCLVFVVLLTPQLIIQVGLFKTAFWLIGALPALAIQAVRIPTQFVRERYLTPFEQRSLFVQRASPFQDVVIRCVRYAFANMPAAIGRVFFSKPVSLPFLRFRMLRHGLTRSPLPWREVNGERFRGIYIVNDDTQRPDVVVFYCHGGGFSMGSSYFYMEFLLAWVYLLKQAGFRNPALFALEYTLVPDACYPTQLQETYAGYQHVLTLVDNPAKVCVAGDSAGGTLVLSLLLHLSDSELQGQLPGFACVISPWTKILSESHRNTVSDYLDADSLHHYGSQYIGTKISHDDPMVSPGHCEDGAQWARASPSRGWLFMFGSEEVLKPDILELITRLRKAGQKVETDEETGGIHAWPVALLYLGDTEKGRLHGLQTAVDAMAQNMRKKQT